jgi:predicted nucleic acid-binding protein
VSIIVSDTSPLQLLVQVGEVHVLERLFGQVVLPTEVVDEMTHPKAPAVVRGFVSALPDWVRTQAPTIQLTLPALDPGEVAAITLAVELVAPLLIDERAGRAVAVAHGVSVIGAIGVLERAADLGLIPDLAAVHARIRALPFRVADAILQASLARHLANRANP